MSQIVRKIGRLTYEKCRALLDILPGVRPNYPVTKKTIGPNTQLEYCPNVFETPLGEKVPDVYIVRFWSTPILAFLPDGRVVIQTNGHETTTTKQRLNALGPVYIHQKNRVWYVGEERYFDGFIVGDSSEEYALFKASQQGDHVAFLALNDYRKERNGQ